MNIPRRNQMQQWCEAERKIYDAVQAVEAMAPDVRLTDAVVLLQAARDRVADFVDGVEGQRTVPGAAALDRLRPFSEASLNAGVGGGPQTGTAPLEEK